MKPAKELFAFATATAATVALLVVPAGSATSGTTTYVAIGDSYSAGIGIPSTTPAGGCHRSDHNFPSLLSAQLGSTSTRDVSCSGATPANTVDGQRDRVAPQFAALDRDTDLVTVRIGFNQQRLFRTLVSACPSVRGLDPTGNPCQRAATASGSDSLLDRADSAGSAVDDVLSGIEQRSPDARIVVVGYPRFAPDSGTCTALPLAAGDYAYVNSVIKRLDDNLAAAARVAGAIYVDMWKASRGHDICAADPWVQGGVNDDGLASPYHPLVAEHRAVAARIATALGTRKLR